MNTEQEHKTALLHNRKLVKQSKELFKRTDSNTTKELALDLIFNTRQLQHDHILLAKREYPKINWHSLI